jgi:hypothetical protein
MKTQQIGKKPFDESLLEKTTTRMQSELKKSLEIMHTEYQLLRLIFKILLWLEKVVQVL